MREQLSRHVIMAAPAPGFTLRLMTRIQEQERRAARRRAMVGAGLLALAGFIPFVLIGALLASLWLFVSTNPDLFVTGMVALNPALDVAATVGNALWLAGTTLIDLASGQMLAYALVVLALTLLWVRVAGGSFRLAPHIADMGGSS